MGVCLGLPVFKETVLNPSFLNLSTAEEVATEVFQFLQCVKDWYFEAAVVSGFIDVGCTSVTCMESAKNVYIQKLWSILQTFIFGVQALSRVL